MLLVIDVGNTRIKAAVFEQYTLLERVSFSNETLANNIDLILKKHQKISSLVVSSVGNFEKEVFSKINSNIKTYFITKDIRFPFNNLYKTPDSLGIDRMVLAAGAVLQFPNQNRLVIDAGTCVTYDFIDAENNYLGGAISPGIRLRYESLNNYTAKLPLLTKSIPQNFIGNSTQNSIHSGIINGLTNEIDGFIEDYQEHYANIIIILTGGDSEFLANRLKNTIFANSNFLLESLNQTFQYNHK